MGMMQNVMTLTDAAADQVKSLMALGEARAEGEVLGLRVGVEKGGCTGMKYIVEYATDRRKFEEVVEDKGVTIFIDPMAIMFLMGSEMDYQTSTFSSTFTFSNPNETAKCGCGESVSFG